MNKLIFLHGFGEDHTAFDEMIDRIIHEIPDVTCYAVDIYFHGLSDKVDVPVSKEEWKRSFQHFLIKEDISSFHLFGFSLGGRFAIATAMGFTRQTKCIFLIAPDGVFQSFWYRFANTYYGNQLFKYLTENPAKFDRLVKYLGNTGFVSKSLIRFVDKTLPTAAQKRRVYQTWTYFHPLQYSLNEIRTHFNLHAFKIFVLLGNKDRIIPPKIISSRLKSIRHLETIIIPARHHQMIGHSISPVISRLKKELL